MRAMESGIAIALCTMTLIAVYAVLKLYSVQKVREARRRYPPLGRFIEVDGVRLHYLREGQGRPVIWIHGSFGSLYDFHYSLRPHLAGRYDITAFDRPGHGYSQRPAKGMTLPEQAMVLREAALKLGLEQPLIAAHSLGSAVALEWALRYPQEISGLFLLSPYVTPFQGPPHPMHLIPTVPVLGRFYLEAMLEPLGRWMGKSIALRVFDPQKPHPDYIQMAMALTLRPSHFAANAADIRGLNAALRKMRARWRGLQVPVTVVTGDQDRISPLERHTDHLREVLPHARIQVLPGIGHRPDFAAPEAVLEGIAEAWRGEKVHG